MLEQTDGFEAGVIVLAQHGVPVPRERRFEKGAGEVSQHGELGRISVGFGTDDTPVLLNKGCTVATLQ